MGEGKDKRIEWMGGWLENEHLHTHRYPCLATLSVLLEESDDVQTVALCLDGSPLMDGGWMSIVDL